MSRMLPTDLTDQLLVGEISLDQWKRLFEALNAARDFADHHEVYSALEHDEAPPALLEALAAVALLGDETGVEALESAAKQRGKTVEEWPSDLGCGDLVIWLFIEALGDPIVAETVQAAQVKVLGLRSLRTVHEFTCSQQVAAVHEPTAVRRALTDWMRAWCAKHGRGDYVEVTPLHLDNEIVYRIVRGERSRRVSLIEQDSQAGRSVRLTRSQRRAAFDLVRFAPSGRRLTVVCGRSGMVDVYKQAFGGLLFGDADAFQAGQVVDLRPLQQGRQAIENTQLRLSCKVLDARLLEITWDRGNGHESVIRSKTDVYEQIEKDKQRLNEGRIVGAKLGLRFEQSNREIRVRLGVPGKVDYLRDKHERLVEPFLEAAGLVSGGRGTDREDLWSTYGWCHDEPRWRAVLREHFDEWVQSGLLQPDDQALRLDMDRLARRLGQELQLDGEPRELPGQTLVSLGIQRHTNAEVLLVAREPSHHFEIQLADHVKNNEPAVLLVPSGRSCETTFKTVGFDWTNLKTLLPTVVDALGDAADGVPGWWRVPATTRLMVEKANKIWLDRVPLDLRPSSDAFAMVILLAERGGVVPYQEIRSHIAPNRADDPWRRWKADFKRSVKGSFARDGLSPPEDLNDIIRAVARGGFQITLVSLVQ